jgi:hypothetical protein
MMFSLFIFEHLRTLKRLSLHLHNPASHLSMATISLILLSACSAPPINAGTVDQPAAPEAGSSTSTAVVPSDPVQQDLSDMMRTDDQGAVEVNVVPISLGPPASDNVILAIWMNTHSVDLSMDLAALSLLETDLGDRVSAISWSGGSGHHVQGELVFPGTNQSGAALLDGASSITLRIVNVDAPERIFNWDLIPR